MAKKRIFGSIARRIFLVCFVLIIIPLIAFSFLTWDRDWRIRLDATLDQLAVMGKSTTAVFENFVSSSQSQLDLTQTTEIEELKKLEELSMVFVFGSDLKCIDSTAKEMVGKGDFFPKELKNALQNGKWVFANQDEIFILKKKNDQVWGLSIPFDVWKQRYAPFKDDVKLSLVNQQGKSFVFTPETLKNWEKELTYSHVRALKNQPIALRLPLKNAQFDLQLEIPGGVAAHIPGSVLIGHLLTLLLFLIIFGVIGGIWLIWRMARPLNQLHQVMDGVKQSDFSVRYQKDRFGFEVNGIGENLNTTLDTLVESMETAKNERVSRELLSKELEIGHEVQKQLLPNSIPQFPDLLLGTGFIPAKEVAGDFYDLFTKDEDTLFLIIADGSDKGISACLYSLMVRSMLRSHAHAEEDLATIVRLTNNLFCQDTQETGNFVTAWIGLYHRKDHRLSYTSAGHDPAILVLEDGNIEELTTQGIALGADKISEIEVKTISISPQSLLFLYTDGLTEAHNEKGELFGKVRLFEFLQSSHALKPQELIDTLLKEVDQFTQGAPQHDDLTLLSLSGSRS